MAVVRSPACADDLSSILLLLAAPHGQSTRPCRR